MQVFVTGGTGLLGNTVIRHLAEQGDKCVALVRSPPAEEVFEGPRDDLAPRLVEGELGEDSAANVIDDAIASCDSVVHSAGLIHLGWQRLDESMRVNKTGTQQIVNACLRHEKKLVFIGSVDAMALGSPEMAADEQTPLSHLGGQVPCSYVKSKRAGLDVVLRAVAKGLDAVVIHPGFMLGPWDWKPSSGRMILEIAKTWAPLSPSGGCSLCDSRDVADGVIAALQSDVQSGRQFIMAGHNWRYQKLWTEMAKRIDCRPPLRSAGPGILYLTGLVGDAKTKLSGCEADFNSAAVKMSTQYHWYRSDRAKRELGYQTRPAAETLDVATQWIRNRFGLP